MRQKKPRLLRHQTLTALMYGKPGKTGSAHLILGLNMSPFQEFRKYWTCQSNIHSGRRLEESVVATCSLVLSKDRENVLNPFTELTELIY
jgi:hypothetical protein